MSPQDSSGESGTVQRFARQQGFGQTMPDELFGAGVISFKCGMEGDPEIGCGHSEAIEVDPADIKLRANGLLQLPKAVPRQCPECGERMHHRYNGVGVSYDV